MANLDSTSPEFQVFCQMVAAFAQGADGAVIAQDTVTQMADDYLQKISDNIANWNTQGLTVLGVARAMGAHAAHNAAHDGSPMIEISHYHSAAEAFDERNDLFCCPFCGSCA